MIKQQFFYNNQEIMRIYHDGFDDYPTHRTIYQEEKLSAGTIVFKESWIHTLDPEEILCHYHAEGFLPSQHDKNPYVTLCCDYKEFITMDKQWVEKMIDEQPRLFDEIAQFIKMWSNFNLHKSPYTLGNILVFTPTKIEVKKILSKENERDFQLRVLQNGYGELMCIAKFKFNNIVVDTKILPVQDQHLLEPSRKWNKVDIELYGNNRLVYACYDVSFIRSIHITMGITTKQIKVPLQLSSKTVVLKDIVYEPITIGEANAEPLNSYFYREKLLASRFIKGRRFEFITKGQYERALEIFEEIVESGGFDHMWVYDRYFMDCSPEGGEKRINDIIKVLGKNNRLSKHIVFKAKSKEDAEQQFEQFQKTIQPTVSFLNKRGFTLNFTFYGTIEPFHDRFLFLINKNNADVFRAFMLGTSFNSFGDNYSAIIELDPLDGKHVFHILEENVVSQNHIVLSRGL